MTISEALSAFDYYYLVNSDRSEKTRNEYRVRLIGKSGFARIIGDIPIEDIAIENVIQWKLYLREQGLKAGYINDCLSSLRCVLKWFTEDDARKYLNRQFNIIDWQKIPFETEEKNEAKTVITPEEVRRLVSYASNLRDKAIIELFFGCGIRYEELIALNRRQWEVANYDEKYDIWEIEVKGKAKKYRPVCFSARVKRAVDRYLAARTDGYEEMWISQQNRRLSYSSVNSMIHKAAARAGLNKVVTPHIFRHSFVTESAANGAPVAALAYQLGHANPSVTQRIYTHLNATHNRRAFAQYAPAA